jgi:8-oxo-dGTP pyrophosphatase MutT (NUDIX family)
MEIPVDLEVTRKIRAAKVAVVRNDGHLLLLRRSRHDERRPNELDFPGGEVLVDLGESDEDAAVRETREETNLNIGGLTLVPLLEVSKVEDRGDEVVEVSQVIFRVIVGHDEALRLIIGDEHEDGAWHPMDVAQHKLREHHAKGMAAAILQEQIAAGELAIAC